jgi:hypothetical protein
MRLFTATVIAVALAGCAGTVNLEPAAQALETAKEAQVRSSAALEAVYAAVCTPPQLLAAKECADARKALDVGSDTSIEALNAAIKAFNEVNDAVREGVE